MNRTILEAVRAMLSDSKLPKTFWAEAVSTAVYVKNRSPTSAHKNLTPFQALNGHKPNVQHFRTFGCMAYAHNPKYHGRSKHIDIKFHYVRDLVRNKKIDLVYCPSNDMLADIFTKGLSAEKFSRLRSKLGVVSYEKHIQCEKEC
ncbi:Ribonuclease H-like domain [Trinorchestia longiramus]|nr:Ribonuclease H-like domain [Trinorchestia longiramus]